MEAKALEALEREIAAKIEGAGSLGELDDVRVAALGKKGRVSGLMQQIAGLAPEERKAFGQTVNALKARVSSALEARRDELEAKDLAKRLETERVDVTLPVAPGPLADGRIHPVAQVFDEIIECFWK